MENTVGFWSILPPLLAIVLSLLTREIVLSLSVAIFSGTLIYTLNGLGNFDADPAFLPVSMFVISRRIRVVKAARPSMAN